ncbi:MAG: hypothetical protein EOO73_14540 [Myxococcales bacterium]|nr:MAG: hypothetical protein EOO73_14540 [Myxococcales bacterium]
MSTDLILQRTATGPGIDRESVSQALAAISAAEGLRCQLAEDQLSILIGLSLPPGDARSAGVAVSYAADGSELVARTHSGSGALLYWCLHALAAKLGCGLFDPQTGGRPQPNSQGFFAEAKAQVMSLEKDIAAESLNSDEEGDTEADVAADAASAAAQLLVGFLRSLVDAEQLALTADARELSHLAPQLKDPSALYEALLDSPLVEDIFLSESELVRALAKYRRR